jgi:hypothetical protein
MSIAASAIGEMPICADSAPAASRKKPPPKRTVTATADAVQQPEAR